jgi:transmembrane sensor
MRWPFLSRRERLRREAANWLARLNGPHEVRDRAAFDQWYGEDADHARAYDRISSVFETAGRARRPTPAEAPATTRAHRARSFGYGLAAAAACAVLLVFLLLSARDIAPVPDARLQVAAFSAPDHASRRISLLDRSEVLLAPGSRLEVAFGVRERRLRLLSGEGTFSVAHETRPFIVAAGGTEVVARGTRFIVSVAGGRTTVALIEGRVDVAYLPPQGGAGRRRVTRLNPGERLVVGAQNDLSSPTRAPGQAHAPAVPQAVPASPPAMLQFDETPLGEAVEQFTRLGGTRIRLADPALAGLRLTGAFRADDPRGFAQSAAAAFGLDLERRADGTLVLRSARAGTTR